MIKDNYSILGIKRSATVGEIKQAYRKLAHKYHPDISKDPDAEEKFKEIQVAYSCIKNSENSFINENSDFEGTFGRVPDDWRKFAFFFKKS